MGPVRGPKVLGEGNSRNRIPYEKGILGILHMLTRTHFRTPRACHIIIICVIESGFHEGREIPHNLPGGLHQIQEQGYPVRWQRCNRPGSLGVFTP